MKIALINNLYYPYNRGGAETVIKKMIADLKSQNHEIFLITTRPRKKSSQKQNELNAAELKTYYFPSHYFDLAAWPEIFKVIWHFLNLFSFCKTNAIKKVLISEKPDLVITHNLMGLGWFLPCALKKLKIRQEHYLHDIQLLYPSGLMLLGQEKIIDTLSAKIYQFFTRLFFASPSKIISPSLWLLEQHRQRGFFKNSKTEIKNLIKLPEEITSSSNPTNKHQTNNKFLFVGQIEKHKGILFLLKTFQSALQINPNIKLAIVGDGALLNEAKKIASASQQIEFHGRLASTQVNDLMAKSDYLIIPSLCYENAPMTIYEAHLAGLPILAANIGGIPEIINNNDKLFKAGDPTDLKNHILDIK